MNAWEKESSANFHLFVQPQSDSDSYIIKPHPEERISIKEAEKIELNCGINDEFESCAFGKTCTFFYDNDSSMTNITCDSLNCTSLAGTFTSKALISCKPVIHHFYFCRKMSG